MIMNKNGFCNIELEKEESESIHLNKVSNLLNEYRGQLDEIDQNIVKLLSDRYRTTDLVGQYKKVQKIEVLDSEREMRLLERVKALSVEYGILTEQEDLEFMVALYELIMSHSRQRQLNNR
ncbi:MAG: hypothetical protein BGO41_15905 [Clostridiales bacterium 38-18]|nr:MAG: hypothetical protein BGO41_15905 [Clostridiales bacterium 38-18]